MPANKINSLIPAINRRKVYGYLINEGTLVCSKNPKLEKHAGTEVPNLHVLLLMRTLTSKGLVVQHYNWKYLYYVLNDEGIDYLRSELRAPPTVMPATMTMTRSARPLRFGERAGGPPNRGGFRGE